MRAAAAIVIVIVLAGAGVGETLRFRSTLIDLERGQTCATLTNRTDTAAIFSGLKWGAAAVLFGLVAMRILLAPARRRGGDVGQAVGGVGRRL